MTHFKTGARYSGRMGDVIAVLLPSIQPGHHYVRLVLWDGENPQVDVSPTPVFSDYIPTLLRHKGFDVNQAQWREYVDVAERDHHEARLASDNTSHEIHNAVRTAI